MGKQKKKNKKIRFDKFINKFIKFISVNGYEPLEKCNKIFFYSIIVFIISLITFIFSLHSNFVDTIITILVLSFFICFISLVSGFRMMAQLEEGKVNTTVITVLNSRFLNFNGIVEAYTEDEQYVEFVHELDIKLKRHYQYEVYYYENEKGENVITYAKKMSVPKIIEKLRAKREQINNS